MEKRGQAFPSNSRIEGMNVGTEAKRKPEEVVWFLSL